MGPVFGMPKSGVGMASPRAEQFAEAAKGVLMRAAVEAAEAAEADGSRGTGRKRRRQAAAQAVVYIDAFNATQPRADLAVDGVHFSDSYYRGQVPLLFNSLCPCAGG